MSVKRVAPANSPGPGIRSSGAAMRSSATPSVVNACQAERATREWLMSPAISTRSCAKSALCCRIGQRIEQALRRMRQVRFAGIEDADMRRDELRDVRRQAGLGVAHDQDVRVHRLQRVDRVEHRLALHARGGLHVEVDDVRAEPLRRELERNARARARLEEQVRDGVSGEALVAGGQVAGRAHVELREIEQRRSARRALRPSSVIRCRRRPSASRCTASWGHVVHGGHRPDMCSCQLLRPFRAGFEPALQQDSRRDHVDVGVRRAAALQARGARVAQLRFGLARAQPLVHQRHRLAIAGSQARPRSCGSQRSVPSACRPCYRGGRPRAAPAAVLGADLVDRGPGRAALRSRAS